MFSTLRRSSAALGVVLSASAGAGAYALNHKGLRSSLVSHATPAEATSKQLELRAQLLTEPKVYCVIAAYTYTNVKKSLDRPSSPIAESDKVIVDFYECSNLTQALGDGRTPDYFLRLHSRDLSAIQAYLKEFSRETHKGQTSDHQLVLVGVTKGLQYVSKEKSPALNSELFKQTYTDPTPTYAVVVPVSKSAAWWAGQSDAARQAMIETHTVVTLPYLKNVKRKLYHSTGLSEADFITYFECDDLAAYQELMVALAKIPENEYHIRRGGPILLGTRKTLAEISAV